jgi:hypothetical protein
MERPKGLNLAVDVEIVTTFSTVYNWLTTLSVSRMCIGGHLKNIFDWPFLSDNTSNSE